MAQKEHDTTVINTSDGSGSGAGWFFVGAFVVLAVILGYFYLGTTDDKKIDVSVDLPKVEQPTTGAPAGDAPASGEQSNQ